MEELIQKYSEECDIISNKPSKIWRIGLIIILILFLIIDFLIKEYVLGIIFLVTFGIGLYIMCEFITFRIITNKLKIKYDNKGIVAKMRKAYRELYVFQEEWILKYCKKNRFNKIQKIEILRDIVNGRMKAKEKKYINPIIFGTLLLNIWEVIIQNLNTQLELYELIVNAIILAFIISLIIGEITKQEELLNIFNKRSGYKRLDELLVYVALKCNG